MIRHPFLAATSVLALLVIWAPLPFASVESWAVGVVEVGAFLALALALLGLRSSEPAVPRSVWGGAAALAAVGVYGALQSVRLPSFVARWLSDGRLEAVGADEVAGVALSVAPWASRWSALLWLAAAALLLASALVGSDRRSRRILLASVLAVAVFEVFYGARRWAAGATEIWGRTVPGDQTRLGGTFVNPNHLAMLLMIALALAGALAWWSFRRASRELVLERRLWLAGGPVALWLLLFVGIAFTGSRAGLLAAIAGALAQATLIVAAQRSWRPAAILAGLGAAGAVAVAWIGGRAGFGRWIASSPDQLTGGARLDVYQAGVELWSRFPILGTGLGTFRDAFPAVQPAETPGTWWHLHNDWLELVITTGVFGLALLVLGLAATAVALRAAWKTGARSEDRAAALAGVGAVVAVGVHELVDFGLTIPANVVALAVVVGAALGGARRALRAAGPRRG